MIHHYPRRRALLLFLSLVVLLGGCALPWARSTITGPQPLPDAQQIFRPLMGFKYGDLYGLDPAFGFGNDNLTQLVFPPLITLDDHNQVVPWAADSWSASTDGLTWTFHIHPGMTWSDGMPIDAGTYAYSINRSLDPCTGSKDSYYRELIKGSADFNGGTCFASTGTPTSGDTLVGKSIIIADPLTLKITLSNPAPYFLAALTYPAAWAQPKQLIERYGPEVLPNGGHASNGWTEHLADDGGFGGNLFTVKRWDHMGHFDLVRNEAFWGQKPKLREIDVTLYHSGTYDYDDHNLMWADYKAGKGDYMSTPPISGLATAKAMPGFHQDLDPTVLYLTPNWGLAPFDDVRVRQAFDLALNRRANGSLPSSARLTPTIHMVPEGVPGYNPGLSDPAGRVGDAALAADPAKAGALWKAYVDEKFGGDASKAPRVAFAYYDGSPTAATNAAAYQQQWQSAMPGLRITLDGGSDYRRSRQMRSFSWIMDYPDPQDFLTLPMHSGSGYNQTSISLPAADALMDQADANLDPVARLAQYQQAEQLLVDAVAWIPVGQALNVYLVRPRMAGGYHERTSGVVALAVWQRIYLTK
jgi:oligopeptide transport system substrate-binding protein